MSTESKGFLVLGLHPNEEFVIVVGGEECVVAFHAYDGANVKLRIQAPQKAGIFTERYIEKKYLMGAQKK